MNAFDLREIDVEIAEKVFGHVVFRNKKGGWSLGPPEYYDDHGESVLLNPLPLYSELIEDSWKIVGKINSISPDTQFSLSMDNEGLWQCKFSVNGDVRSFGESKNQSSASLAICLAAIELINNVR